LGLGITRGRAQSCSEFLGARVLDSFRSKYPSLVATSWMLEVQTVGLQFPKINNGRLAIGQLHG
jgi:hypothetical protein